MVTAAGYLADNAAIRADLLMMTARWGELPRSAMFELRAFDEHGNPQWAQFTPARIGEAVEWAASENAQGRNVYAVRNPIRLDHSGPATDAAVIAAFYCWADCDDAAAVGNVRRFDGPKWTAAVTTGKTPDPRVHLYWELQEPVYNLDAWRQMQVSIAAHFQSDPVVINPSRIMRVGGTISYPPQRKRDRGYVPEPCTIRTLYDDDRSPVEFERLLRVFPPVSAPQRPASGLQIDTGAGLPPALDRALAAANILGDQHWRDNVKSLVCSYVARGWTDDEITARCAAFTLDGYTAEDTQRDVVAFITWARRQEAIKGGSYATSPDGEANPFVDLTDAEIEAIQPALFRPWAEIDLAAIPAPQFIYSDFYARGYTSVTLAAPKVGKSMLGLAEAIDMATGRGFLTGVEREPRRVVYFNAEDDQDVLNSRVAAILTQYRIPQQEIVGRLFPTSGVEMPDFYMASGQECVINEPLFVSIEKFCAAEQADALIFDPLQDLTRSPETNEVFRALGQRLRRMAAKTGVALGLIHHTRKVAPGVTPSIDDMRGGSALRGTARFNRILVGMTEDEAAKGGVLNHRHYFRIGDMESNLAPPSSDVNRWFEKVSVETPNHHHVGAVRPWKWPDAFEGVGVAEAIRVQRAVAACAEPPKASVQARGWVGQIVAETLGLDLEVKADKARVSAMLKAWIASDVLRVETRLSKRDGREVPVVVTGDNRMDAAP